MKIVAIITLVILSSSSLAQIGQMNNATIKKCSTHDFDSYLNYNLNNSFSNQSKSNLYPYFIAYLPKIKYEFGSISSINIGLSTIDYQGDDIVQIPAWMYRGPFVETGLAFKDQSKFMCNKIGYEYFLLFFGGRLNVVHYTDFRSNQFNLRPELGLTFFSILTFTYGYNFNMYSRNELVKNGSIFSVNVAYFINKKEYRN